MARYKGFPAPTRASIVEQLLQRDGALCGICSVALSTTTNPDDPSLTTIDHIVPISAGGEGGSEISIDNLRLAHRVCNGLVAKFPTRSAGWFARELRDALTRFERTS
jgi:5-methylcytosine-specific restriction endonuclease McrA